MSKRSTYPREPRDLYRTVDPRAVPPLLLHVKPGTRFVEPCAGAGDLSDRLVAAGLVRMAAFDIEPLRADIQRADARGFQMPPQWEAEFITNPPWTREILHALIWWLSAQAPTWLLFDADWMHTLQAAPFKPIMTDVVSVGRLKWFTEDDPRQKGNDPMDNCAWYRFAGDKWGATKFWGRI